MRRCCFFCLLVLLLAPTLCFSSHKQEYKYFRIGNKSDVVTKPAPSFLLQGGSDLDDAFRWMCAKANGGDFLVLRATGKDAYNPYIQGLCKLNSVASLVIPSRNAAGEKFVVDTIRHAEAIFIAGGDQANYINFWMGTEVQAAINDAIARGVPVGGNSAGLAVLGEFTFAALNDTAYSKVVLADPFDKTVTIVRGFLNIPILAGVITDTHFAKRDRLGRLTVFMARIVQDGQAPRVRAIAVDEGGAVALEPDGSATMFGAKPAYFIESQSAPLECRAGTPLTFGPLKVYKLQGGGRFNVKAWSGEGGAAYDLKVENGTVTSTQPGGSLY